MKSVDTVAIIGTVHVSFCSCRLACSRTQSRSRLAPSRRRCSCWKQRETRASMRFEPFVTELRRKSRRLKHTSTCKAQQHGCAWGVLRQELYQSERFVSSFCVIYTSVQSALRVFPPFPACRLSRGFGFVGACWMLFGCHRSCSCGNASAPSAPSCSYSSCVATSAPASWNAASATQKLSCVRARTTSACLYCCFFFAMGCYFRFPQLLAVVVVFVCLFVRSFV